MSEESDPRIADTLDETCHDLREIVDRVDDGEAETHLNLAISHLEHVARWDRDERGETPTDALRDFVTDGGVDQSDGETDHSGREPEDTEAADQVLREALGDDLPDGFLDDEEENERSGDATRTDGGVDCHELTPSDDADLPRTNAETQLPEIRFVDRFESDDDVYYAVTEENGVRLYRVTGDTTIVRGLLAYDAVIHAGDGSPSITTPSYNEQYETIDLYHHMGGRKASFRADRILDEPVITLAEANRV